MSAAQSSTSNLITDTCKISTDAPQRRWPTEEGNDAGATALKRQRLVFSSAKAASQRKIKKLGASNMTEEMLPVSTRYMQKKVCRPVGYMKVFQRGVTLMLCQSNKLLIPAFVLHRVTFQW